MEVVALDALEHESRAAMLVTSMLITSIIESTNLQNVQSQPDI